ncbi:hypothetical protein B0G83_110189 [Paraburkholderia sp. BL21I4N1]|nr:hypothetical protein B0G83_110189 [Paraburkholderia sp. BL21I4N1]
MNMFLKIIVATVIAIPGTTFAQNKVSALHADTTTDPDSRSPFAKSDYSASKQSTESTGQYERKLPEPRTDVVLSPYSPPIHDVKK